MKVGENFGEIAPCDDEILARTFILLPLLGKISGLHIFYEKMASKFSFLPLGCLPLKPDMESNPKKVTFRSDTKKNLALNTFSYFLVRLYIHVCALLYRILSLFLVDI